MADDDSERRVLSRKALAKEQRRAAYQKAKQRRDSDPRYLLMKQQAKEQRRAAYQKVKERRKAEAQAQKLAAKLGPNPNEVRTRRLQLKFGAPGSSSVSPEVESGPAEGEVAEPAVEGSDLIPAMVINCLSKGSSAAN
jgi:hypothetical protein